MSFARFAESCGLLLPDLVPDGRIRRCATSDKPRSRNGAFMYAGDWGWCQNWATQDEPQIWQGEDAAKPIDPARLREMARQRAALLSAQREKASRTAAAIVAGCQIDKHAYLDRKGFSEAVGLVDGEKRLVIPMRDVEAYPNVLSVQRIAIDGEKRFLSGGRTKGAALFLGNQRAAQTWLCEGYATALSVETALKRMCWPARVAVCFSAANLAHVAGRLRGERFVVADNDESGTGERFARATGLPWGMPKTVGTDANDLQRSGGVEALASLLREIRAAE